MTMVRNAAAHDYSSAVKRTLFNSPTDPDNNNNLIAICPPHCYYPPQHVGHACCDRRLRCCALSLPFRHFIIAGCFTPMPTMLPLVVGSQTDSLPPDCDRIPTSPPPAATRTAALQGHSGQDARRQPV